jgi:hypothetical protein
MIIIFIITLILVILFSKINQNEYAFYYASSVKPTPKKCNKQCPKHLDPVYDTNGNRYPNACSFENAKCKNPKLQLRTSAPQKCDKMCNENLDPVYDTYGNRYPNACSFENAKCKNPKLQICQAEHKCIKVPSVAYLTTRRHPLHP